MLQWREEEMRKEMASGGSRFKRWVVLYSLTGGGGVRKDGRDSSSDSKWLTTQAIRLKHNAGAKGSMCSEKYCNASDLKGVSGFLHDGGRGVKQNDRMEKGDFVAGCVGKYCAIIILFPGTCSDCLNPVSLSLSSLLRVHVALARSCLTSTISLLI